MQEVVQRFLHYVKFETTSEVRSTKSPSTKGQILLAKELVKELKALGLKNVTRDKNGIVMAALPGNNTKKDCPAVGFIAHLDTSSDFTSREVKPQYIHDYRGGDIALNNELGIYLKPEEFPELQRYVGEDLITTDGTTLLGADDKAGIAEIVTAMSYLCQHPEIKHGPIRVAFTPDEELGLLGAKNLDIGKFKADFAYTVDTGEVGTIHHENFNAATAKLTICGKVVHPNYAKGKMINSMLFIKDIIEYFPTAETPAQTEGYEGFFHLREIYGSVDKTTLIYGIRDHDLEKFKLRKEFMQACQEYINCKYGQALLKVEIEDALYNMKEVLDQHPYVTELAVQAMQELGIRPVLKPIRGATDGSYLSLKGLPTPNIFTGGHNNHSRFEFISVQSMEKAVQTIVRICEKAGNISLKASKSSYVEGG